MLACPRCDHRLTETASTCPACGAALGDIGPSSVLSLHLEDEPADTDASTAAVYPEVPEPPPDGGRLLPGALIADRYRIVGPLGAGGMGEVWRADDLRLGQPVALKFLPDGLQRAPAALARLHDEVRIARQVAHPGVCRVHDIGEADGLTFLSMEYVDGEDLASLQRRIGRLPADRAGEIARQLCAALAEAHGRGVLHRDLKPANVMLDGRGQVRIMDFGLSSLEADTGAPRGLSGTPAYLAPEVIEGGAPTARSDLYALALVLYELYTGERAFRADDFAEMARLQCEVDPTPPGRLVSDLDEGVERALLACLRKDPAERPASALELGASLPGGDSFAALLAAGHTPSPEMVAAGGERGGLGRRAGIALNLAIAACVLAIAWLNGARGIARYAPLEKPPEVLEERAREALVLAGHGGDGPFRARGFERDPAPERFLEAAGEDAWEELSGLGAPWVRFWYRESPSPHLPRDLAGRVEVDDPPYWRPGMARVLLRPTGELVELEVVPGAAAPADPAEPDWSGLLAAGGLDLADLEETEPAATPPVACDGQRAWSGTWPTARGRPVRVDGAQFRGRVVWLRFETQWGEGAESGAPEPWRVTGLTMRGLLNVVALFVGIWFARGSLRRGRGDRRGAFRIAFYYLACSLAAWAFTAGHAPHLGFEWRLFVRFLSGALFTALFAWVVYLTLEPFVRRYWPDCLVSWSRLLTGRVRDPLVGRDVLIGTFCGALLVLRHRLHHLVAGPLGGRAPSPPELDLDGALGPRLLMGELLVAHQDMLVAALVMLFLLVFLRRLLRFTALAAVAGAALLAWMWPPESASGSLPLDQASLVFGALLLVVLMTRFGLVACVVAMTWGTFLGSAPFTLELGAWHAGSSVFVLAAVGIAMAFGYRTAVRRPAPGPRAE